MPTLLVISVIVFTVVQLPPGDFITSKTLELSLNGDANAEAQLADLRKTFRFDEPAWSQYLHWMGFSWFVHFDAADTGLLQGNLGRSMESNLPVNEILGDRLLLTFVISILTILFTWVLAIPIGIYSAVRRYTWGDYGLTLLGFIGMSVPPFLLALVLMWASAEYLGITDPAQAAWLMGLLTPQPFRTYLDRLELKNPLGNGVLGTYIAASNPVFATTVRSREIAHSMPGWNFLEIPTGHNAMTTMPRELTEMLAEIG